MLSELMTHALDFYAVSHTKDTSGADKPSYPTATYSSVPCFFAQEVSDNNQNFGSFKEVKKGLCFITNSTVYAACTLESRVVVNSVKYRVTGKQNPCGKNVLFVLRLEQDISGV